MASDRLAPFRFTWCDPIPDRREHVTQPLTVPELDEAWRAVSSTPPYVRVQARASFHAERWLTGKSRVWYIKHMETWKEFEANELTHSAAHHLLAIHDVGAPYGGWARVSDIARRLNITRGSVSINLRTLKKRGWVQTDAHRLVKLSPKGLTVVHSVIAKRVIVKTFLSDVLGIPEAQAEIDSCKIEHLISHSTGERLVRFLQFLTSGSPVNRQRVKQFRALQASCPESRTCDVCKGHCLIDELKYGT